MGQNNFKTWLVAVNMGYGHQRAAFPLQGLARRGQIINANNYQGIPVKDRKIWERARKFYEFISRFKRFPIFGQIAFSLYDGFQKIVQYYPKRDLSKPNFILKQNFALIKNGWGKHLIEALRLQNADLPLITTFFIPAFMAEVHKYPGQIYCVVCDADISRTWVSLHPQKSKIKYFVPTSWAENRLKLYGVKAENIFLTGYPLPFENLGTENLEVLKNDLRHRLLNLDPDKNYLKYFQPLVKKYLGKLPKTANHPPTLMFAVGGAGAQKEIGIHLARSLAKKIKDKEIKLILVAGIREKVKKYFEKHLQKLNLSIEIIFENDINKYFQKFNQALRKTDILWTKPSELSFYTALGIPIVIAPPVGSQEDFNKRWLLAVGAGMVQENPKYSHQWLFDFLKSGRFAETAMHGFIKGEKLGTFKIKEIIFNKNSVFPVLEKQSRCNRDVRNRRFLKERGSGKTV